MNTERYVWLFDFISKWHDTFCRSFQVKARFLMLRVNLKTGVEETK